MKKSQNNSTRAASLALIGCGAIAERFYLPALAKLSSRISHVVLVDASKARASAMAKQFNIPLWTNRYQDVIGEVDGAVVALPNHLHHPVSIDFLRAGVHVLCEKPLAETEEHVREMVSKAESHGVQLAVNHTRRLYPSFRKVKELLESGAIGQPVEVFMEVGGEYNWPTVSGFYFNSKGASHGVLMDHGPHLVDLQCWWLGSRPEVISYQDDALGGCEAVAELRLQFNGSVNTFLKLSWLNKLSNQLIVRGQNGSLICEPYDWRSVIHELKGKRRKVPVVSSQKDEAEFGVEMVNNFLNVIRGSERPLISAKDAVHSISVIEEAYRRRQTFNMPWLQPQVSA